MNEELQSLFDERITLNGNVITTAGNMELLPANQDQTKDSFSDKWTEVNAIKDVENLYEFQRDWFLTLYGFDCETDFREFLKDKKYIIDTGCGLGYKAAWFARLAPHAIVLGVDISDAVTLAAENYQSVPNLFFFRADIACTGLKANSMDFVVCDQVIMHTQDPERTFVHLSDITRHGGEFACYVYRKKALPRELVDDYFRTQTHNISKEDMWAFSEQLTQLGKALTDMNASFTCPDIPVLGIKGGEYDVQRFIYWNFLKCFWKEDWSFDLNKSTNYDWYSPSNAKRFSKEEFQEMGKKSSLTVSAFHEEEACYSARFRK